MTDFDRKAAGREGEKLFANSALQSFACEMAAGHPYALDTIRQAPVIVLAANSGRTGGCGWDARGNAAAQLAWALDQKRRLHDVMRLFSCGSHLRRLDGKALNPKDWDMVRFIGNMPAQKVAPAIPDSVREQKAWLRAIESWSDRLKGRSRNRVRDLRLLGLPWAVGALRDCPRGEHGTAADLADFYAVATGTIDQPGIYGDRPVFDPTWSYEQARRAQERWHVALSKIKVDSAAFAAAGFGDGEAVPYHPFPDQPVMISDFEFVPLRTCLDVFEEGARMHHCAATYAPDVASGSARLYSMRQDGKRLATVCYRRRGAHGHAYELEQIQGVCSAKAKGAWILAARHLFNEVMRYLAAPGYGTEPKPRNLRDAFPGVGGQFSDEAAAG